MTSLTVLRTERDGVEFFTVVATGESGMSQSGLARACGVSRQALIKIEQALVTKSSLKTPKPSTGKGFAPVTKAPSKWLQPFAGKDLTLMRDYSNSDGKTRNVTIYTAEFCAAVIKHYAYSGSKAAQDFDSSLGVIGLTSYIQSQTGWLPEEFKAAPKEHDKLDQYLSLALEWDRGVMMVVDWDSYYADLADLADNSSFYEEQGVSIPIKLENYEVDMSDSWTFFDAVVFSGFTPEEFIKFQDETKELGFQKHSKNEQVKLFFERNSEIAERQKPYTEKVQRMLSKNKNPQLFKTLFVKAFGSHYDTIYCELECSASALRFYKRGYADRTQYADPRYPYSRDPDYMEGWNANTSASLVNQ
jgi:transcriptional regulator with XRE-family HTH domain